jgi:hypothetical protein
MNSQTSADEQLQEQSYTALVYFHGIGEQKRYEEVSRLVDELERHNRKADQDNPFIATGFEFEEPRSDKLTRDVGYIRMTRKDPMGQEREYRFYDAYYANQIAGGQPSLEVFLWLLRLARRPVDILRQHWRDAVRLRRATLLGGWDRYARTADPKQPDEYRKQREVDRENLLRAHDKFRELELIGVYPKGLFRDFLKTFYEKDPFPGYLKAFFSPSSQVERDAFWWWRRFVRVQLNIILIVLTMLLTLALLLGSALGVLASARLLPLAFTLGTLIVIFLLGYGIRGFLRHYLGDLYLWTTYEETAAKNEKRRKILNTSIGYLSHVLQDETCKRVVLIGHSMGTTVAHDSILELASFNRAKKIKDSIRRDLPLYKIQQFVTFGSVIDKVHYLFETVSSPSYRYTAVIENIRGDLGTVPFSNDFDQKDKAAKLPLPNIYWINFWDQADLASSPLYTPTNRQFYQQHNYMVDNYEVVNDCPPLPSNAHSMYLKNEEVIGSIYKLCFDDTPNFQEFQQSWLSKMEGQLPRLGRGIKGLPTTARFQILVALVPWMIFLNLISVLASGPVPNLGLLIALGANIVLALAVGTRDWRLRSRRNKEAAGEAIQSTDPIPAG